MGGINNSAMLYLGL